MKGWGGNKIKMIKVYHKLNIMINFSVYYNVNIQTKYLYTQLCLKTNISLLKLNIIQIC